LKTWLTMSLTLFLLQVSCLSPALADAVRKGEGLTLIATVIGVVFLYSLIPATIAVGAMAVGRLVGGASVALGTIFVLGPVLAVAWGRTLSREGVEPAIELLAYPPMVISLAIVACAVARVAMVVVSRLSTRYYLTSRQALEIRVGRSAARVVWRAPLSKGWLQFRVVRPFGFRNRGHIAVGTGRRRRLLRWLDAPDETLEEIKRAVGDFEGRPDKTSPDA
jgi:hypothetical protein